MQLHCAMARSVIERAGNLFEDVVLAADDISHPFFAEMNLPIIGQGGGDLGERMKRLMLQSFADGRQSVMFLGTDSPHMLRSRLEQASQALTQHPLVIGPVSDGGYDLIAMTCPLEALFNGIDWGSERVLAQTLGIVADLNVEPVLLTESFDIDSADDLMRAVQTGWNPCLDFVEF